MVKSLEDADSDPLEVASAKAIFLSPTTGSRIVNVCTLSPPTVALEGFDKVKITKKGNNSQRIRSNNTPFCEKKNTRVFMGKRRWLIETNILELDNPWLRRVEIDVFEMVDGDRVGPISHTVSLIGQY